MRGFLLLLCLLLSACGSGRADPPPDAAALRARLGSAEVIAASLLLQTQPAQGDGETFTLRLWAAADGQVRVRAQKLDVDFLEALIRADGAYEAWLPREKAATSGRLDDAQVPLLLADLRLLLAELRHGPLPPGVVPGPGWTWSADGRDLALGLDHDGLPSTKTLNRAGAVELELAYAQWKDFDGLLRPVSVRLHQVASGDRLAIRLKSLDTPPVISAERMTLRVPEAAERVEPAAFSRRMLGPAAE
jgi:hypothetical protein